MNDELNKQLEQYTVKYPQEVLLVNVEVGGEADRIAIFKGFSSSLMRPTAYDPEIPVLSKSAKIISIDRVVSPYNPRQPQYIHKGMTLKEMEELLANLEF